MTPTLYSAAHAAASETAVFVPGGAASTVAVARTAARLATIADRHRALRALTLDGTGLNEVARARRIAVLGTGCLLSVWGNRRLATPDAHLPRI